MDKIRLYETAKPRSFMWKWSHFLKCTQDTQIRKKVRKIWYKKVFLYLWYQIGLFVPRSPRLDLPNDQIVVLKKNRTNVDPYRLR